MAECQTSTFGEDARREKQAESPNPNPPPSPETIPLSLLGECSSSPSLCPTRPSSDCARSLGSFELFSPRRSFPVSPPPSCIGCTLLSANAPVRSGSALSCGLWVAVVAVGPVPRCGPGEPVAFSGRRRCTAVPCPAVGPTYWVGTSSRLSGPHSGPAFWLARATGCVGPFGPS